jgi:hypothetical protein
MLITVLLLGSNVFSLVLVSSNYAILHKERNQVTSGLVALDWLQSLSFSLADLTFCVSHWIFACYYFRVAHKMPAIVDKSI